MREQVRGYTTNTVGVSCEWLRTCETNLAVRIWHICHLSCGVHLPFLMALRRLAVAVRQGEIGMSKLLKSLVVGTLGVSLALASPALGRGGGGFGGGGHGGFGGGMHGGFGGGMHGGFGGGMHAM